MVDAVVVDDSQFMRVQIAEVLKDGGITVVGDAANGKEAIDAVEHHDPDVVTMDVKMPGMDGIEAVERIMETDPTPILMLSRYTEEGADTTFEALEAGAVDFFRKPGGEVSTSLVQFADDLVEAVSVVATADVSAVPSADAPEQRRSRRHRGRQHSHRRYSSPPRRAGRQRSSPYSPRCRKR
ncbi:response regulator [Halovenus salina]|uniref:Response regulator n=1 Tax=Halovenus salina TaxID=1510225 RepID=A0ABD5W3X4_9EURY